MDMTQTVSSLNRGHKRVPFRLVRDANGGDIEAMTLIGRQLEPYIRRLATINVCGTSFLNTDLYDRLKTRLILETLKFQL
jgi:hypothetical protein